MMTRMLRGVAVAALLMAAAANAEAAVVAMDDPTFGKGELTLDTVTGLEFLNTSFSNGLSFQDVSSMLQPGGRLAGFRFATAPEAFALFLDSGGSSLSSRANLIALLGSTYSNGHEIDAFTGTDAPQANSDDAFELRAYGQGDPLGGFESENYPLDAAGFIGVASFLVRTGAVVAVPEPSTLSALALGLVGLGFARRIRR